MIFGGLVLGTAPLVHAEAEIPDRPLGPNGEDWYVLDGADVLSDETESTLQTQLSTLAAETSVGMVVVTVSTLNDYPIEMYALELGREWGAGQDEFDNGLIFLVAPDEREVRIEVGYGLEGVITDAQSSVILRKVTTPYFQAGDYDQGVLETMMHLEALARNEAFDLEEIDSTSESSFGDWLSIFIFFILPLGWALLSWFSSTKSWWIGGVFGGIFGFIVGSLTGLAIGAVGGLFLDYVLSTYLFSKIKPPRGGGGGFWFGGGRHGGGGSSSGGIGGFGGGGFGGGGATGRW